MMTETSSQILADLPLEHFDALTALDNKPHLRLTEEMK